VTASGSIDSTHPVLEDGAMVLTTARGASSLRGRIPAAAEVVELPGGDLVDLDAAVAALRERGHDLVLSEAGPTMFGSLLGVGLVDELFLTVSPLLAGRDDDDRRSLVEGTELLPTVQARGTLIGARRHDAHLFLRYRV
jgi:riboflavin biosynthesis pyrimidine reductase